MKEEKEEEKPAGEKKISDSRSRRELRFLAEREGFS